jgi:hypothetical protein
MIDAFGGPTTARGNTGPFWVASGLAIFSALVTFFMIRPLSHDGMVDEDIKVCRYSPVLAIMHLRLALFLVP